MKVASFISTFPILISISVNCFHLDGNDFSSVDFLVNDVKEEEPREGGIERRQGSNWSLPAMFTTQSTPVTMYPPIDGKDCDTKSIGFIVRSEGEVDERRKEFKNCTFTRGELVTISNIANERHVLGVMCRSNFPINDTVSGIVKYHETFVLDVYIDPRNDIEPQWTCFIRRPSIDLSEIKLDVFEGFKVKNTFEYDVTTVGVFDVNPVLVTKWEPQYHNVPSDPSLSSDSDSD